jgi:hypothetical protein
VQYIIVVSVVATSIQEDDTIFRTQAAEAKSLAHYRESVKRS